MRVANEPTEEFGVFPTEEVQFFGGEVYTVKESTFVSTIKVLTLMLSLCSLTFGLYIVLAAMGGSL